MSEILNRRVLLQRTQELCKTNAPTLQHISSVGEALSNVITDLLGANCRVVIKVDAKALEKAIAENEASK